MWTASAAGWMVLGMVTGFEVCFIAGFACILVAYAWIDIADRED
jgi:hypothetical protein